MALGEHCKASTYAIEAGIENRALLPPLLDLETVQELSEPLALVRQHMDGVERHVRRLGRVRKGLQDIGIDKVLEMTTAANQR